MSSLNEGLKTTEISEAESSFISLIKKMKKMIDRGEYGLIISDDASGRIPSIVLWHTLNKIARRKRRPAVKIIFLEGSSGGEAKKKMIKEKLRSKAMQSYIKKALEGERRALLVTEHIEMGSTVRNFCDIFREEGLSCDVATIGLGAYSQRSLRGQLGKLGHNLFVGSFSNKGLSSFYSKEHLTGLDWEGRINDPKIRAFVIRANKDAKIFGKRLADVYYKERALAQKKKKTRKVRQPA